VKGRPVIGVTGPDRGGLIAWWMTAIALRRCGAKPLRITPGRVFDSLNYGEERDLSAAESGLARASALDWVVGWILAIFRAMFASHTNQGYDRERDELEKHLIQQAHSLNMPTLGICRGAQLMNVTLGGSLHQDIGHFYTEETSNVRSILPRKKVDVTQPGLLHSILVQDSCVVNALHDQSIKALGDDIIVSACEPNGVIQAIEKRGHVFFLGVQWHPEYIPQSNIQQGLFRHLVQCAREPGAGL
jgi:putative glutamine amidotransferase